MEAEEAQEEVCGEEEADEFGLIDGVSCGCAEVVAQYCRFLHARPVKHSRCADPIVAVGAVRVDPVSRLRRPAGLRFGRGFLVGGYGDRERRAPSGGESYRLDRLHVVRVEVVGSQDFVQGASVVLHEARGFPDVGVERVRFREGAHARGFLGDVDVDK